MRPIESEASAESAAGIVAIWAAECVAALLILLQRLTGAAESFPSPAAVLVFAVVCLAVNQMSIALLRAPLRKASESRLNGVAPIAVTCLPPLVIGLALLPPEAAGERAALWVCGLFSAVTVVWISRRTDCQSVLPQEAPPDNALLSEDSESRLNEPIPRIDLPAEPETEFVDSPVVANGGESTDPLRQSMQRRLSADGRETVEGEFIASFIAGQKTAVVHFAFCPPLPGVPDVECEPLDAADIRWKLAVAQPYGVRIDVQRSGPISRPAEIRLAWFATSQSRPAKAA